MGASFGARMDVEDFVGGAGGGVVMAGVGGGE